MAITHVLFDLDDTLVAEESSVEAGTGYAPSALVAAATRQTPRALGVVPSQPS